VRRLSFAPEEKEMRVTDVKTGHFLFRPRGDRPARFVELRREVVNQGYDVEATVIEVRGVPDANATFTATGTGQVFALAGPLAIELAKAVEVGAVVDVMGKWQGDETSDTIEVTRWQAVP
jgi:hypothetical protein